MLNRCIEVPDETCVTLIPYMYYTPDTFGLTEQIVNDFSGVITEYDPFDPCRAFIAAISCVYRYPPCDPSTGTLFPICPAVCPTVNSDIENCALESYEEYPSVGAFINSFECTEPETYLRNVPPQYINNGTACTELSKCIINYVCIWDGRRWNSCKRHSKFDVCT